MHPDLVATADDSRIQLNRTRNEDSVLDNDDEEAFKGKSRKPFLFSSPFSPHETQSNHADDATVSSPPFQNNQPRGPAVGATSYSSRLLLPSNRFPLWLLCCRTMTYVCCGGKVAPNDDKNDTMSWTTAVIRLGTLGTVVVTVVATLDYGRSWIMALYCTCTVTVCMVIWYQLERFHVLHQVRQELQRTRLAHQRVSLQTQVLWQQLERMQHVQDDLHHTVVAPLQEWMDQQQQTESLSFSWTRWHELAQEWNHVQEEMDRALQLELQQQLLTVVLDCDVNGDFVLSDREWRQLQVRLHHIPGLDAVIQQQPPPQEQPQQEPLEEATTSTNLVQDSDDDDDDDQDTTNKDTKGSKHKDTNCRSVIEVLRMVQQHQQHHERKQQQQQSHYRQHYPKTKASTPVGTFSSTARTIQLTPHVQVQWDPEQALGRRGPTKHNS